MPKIAKVFGGPAWQTLYGTLCAVLSGRDDQNNEVSIAVPAGIFQVLAAEARRRLAAAKTTAEAGSLPSDWHHVNFLSGRTIQVGTTDDQRVGVILDQGLDTEFRLSFASEDARQLYPTAGC